MKVLYIPVLFFVFCPVKTNPPVEHILISSSRTPLILLFTRRKERAVSKKLAQREAPRAIAATAVVALLRNVLELAKFSHFCADFSRSWSPWFPLRKRQGRDGCRFRVLWCRASYLVCGCFPAKKRTACLPRPPGALCHRETSRRSVREGYVCTKVYKRGIRRKRHISILSKLKGKKKDCIRNLGILNASTY